MPGAGGGEAPRLGPFAETYAHNRARVVRPMTGRYFQMDPNASGMAFGVALAFHGDAPRAIQNDLDALTRYTDGANLYHYLGSNSWVTNDPSGLLLDTLIVVGLQAAAAVTPGPGDFIRSVLTALLQEYSINLNWDAKWAGNWKADDEAHSRRDNRWVKQAIGQGLHDAFDIGIGDVSVNTLDLFGGGKKKRDSFRLPKGVKSAKGVAGQLSNKWKYRIDTNNIQPAEGGFHVHIYNNRGDEVAKVSGNGTWAKSHMGRNLYGRHEIPTQAASEIDRLVRWASDALDGGG